MPHPFPVPSVPEIMPENIDGETKKMIEESSERIAQYAKNLDPETLMNVIVVAMVASYRCGETAEAFKSLQSQ